MKEEQLHETVLRVIFHSNPERPELLSTDDVYWKIEDPVLQLPRVKEVLEWLVHQGDLKKDLGKYELTRPKFFELKALFAAPAPVEQETKTPKKKPKTKKAGKPKAVEEVEEVNVASQRPANSAKTQSPPPAEVLAAPSTPPPSLELQVSQEPAITPPPSPELPPQQFALPPQAKILGIGVSTLLGILLIVLSLRVATGLEPFVSPTLLAILWTGGVLTGIAFFSFLHLLKTNEGGVS